MKLSNDQFSLIIIVTSGLLLLVVILETFLDFPNYQFSSNAEPDLLPKHMNELTQVRELRVKSLNDYIKFLSKSVRIFSYFGKIFDYGSLRSSALVRSIRN